MELTFRDAEVWKRAIRDFSEFGKVRFWKSHEFEVRRYNVFIGRYEELMEILGKSESRIARLIEKSAKALREAVERGILDDFAGKSEDEVKRILVEELDELRELRELQKMPQPAESEELNKVLSKLVDTIVDYAFYETFVLDPMMEAIRRLIGKENKMEILMESVFIDVTPILGEFDLDEEKIKIVDHVFVTPVYKLSLDIWWIDDEIQDVLMKYKEHYDEDINEVIAAMNAKEGVVERLLDIIDEKKIREEDAINETHLLLRKTAFVLDDKYEFRAFVEPEVIRDAIEFLDGVFIKRKGKLIKKK